MILREKSKRRNFARIFRFSLSIVPKSVASAAQKPIVVSIAMEEGFKKIIYVSKQNDSVFGIL